MTIAPASVAYGTSATGTITLAAASTSATTITLASNSPYAVVPANVMVGANNTTATFTITTSYDFGDTQATITASNNGANATATLEIVVPGAWTSATATPTRLGTAILMTDGTVLAHSSYEGGKFSYTDWYKLTPDAQGNYSDGVWTAVAPSTVGRLYGETAILNNGDLFYGGGYELSNGDNDFNTAEVYSSVTNTWTEAPDSLYPELYVTGSALLPDGELLCSSDQLSNTDIYNPTTNTWAATGAQLNGSTGTYENWLSMADGSILNTYNNAQRYLPTTGAWQATGPLPGTLVDNFGIVGPGAELYNGKSIIFSGTGSTAIYTPPALVTGAGSWIAGPTLPNNLGAGWVPSCVERSGKVLLAASTANNDYYSNVKFLEYDPITNLFTVIPSPVGEQLVTSNCNMLALPNGQVLLMGGETSDWVYSPAGYQNYSWEPTVTNVAETATNGTYLVTGTQLNGLTNGASNGFAQNPSTAYPIVELVDNNGNAYYQRTYDFSQMEPSAPGATETAEFTPPLTLPYGTYSLYAIASSVSSQAYSFTSRYVPPISITSSLNPSTYGHSVTFTAIVNGNPAVPANKPTGTLQFQINGVNVGAAQTLTASDTVTYTTATLLPGTYTVTATYSGDQNNTPNNGALSPVEVVNKLGTTITLATSQDPSNLGQSVTFTATVTGAGTPAPTGTVTFTDTNPVSMNTTTLGTIALTGDTASFTTTSLTAGTHDISATYSGDVYNAVSAQPATLPQGGQEVALPSTTTVVTASPNPSSFGQSVQFTATVTGPTGTPSGTVTFYVDGTAVTPSSTLNAGQAVYTTSALTAGTHQITASYSGDVNFAAGTTASALTQTVSQGATTVGLTSSVNPSVSGTNVTFTATVSGAGTTPTGTVTFSVDGVVGTPVTMANGVATYSTAALSIGPHQIIAQYSGDPNYKTGATTAPLTQTVTNVPTTTTLVSSANPSVYGSGVTFTATVTGSGGTPTGTVTFSVDGTAQTPAATLSAGTATFTTTTLIPGSHQVTASYSGDSTYAPSTPTQAIKQVVNTAPSATTVASSLNPSGYGQSVTFTATVTGVGGTPTGTVTFLLDGSAETPVTLSTSGTATFTTETLSGGTHTVAADYSGDLYLAPSTGTLSPAQSVQLIGTTTTVTSSANPSAFGQPVTFTATVAAATGTPTGSLTFTVDGVAHQAQSLSAGVATLTVSNLSVGSHTISAAYAGTSTYAASSDSTTPLTQTIGKGSSTTTLTSSLNPSTYGASVTFTATVAGAGTTPTGSVTFYVDGSATTSQTLSNGTATYSNALLLAGTHVITASYGGDGNYTTSTTATSLSQVVNQAATTVALSTSGTPSAYGAAVTFTATIGPVGSTPTGTVTFSIDGTAETPSTVSGHTASFDTSSLSSPLAPGAHTITATYSGDTNYLSSTAGSPLTQTVSTVASTTSLASSLNPATYGSAVTFTASVTGADATPTGSVVFTIDGAAGNAIPLSNSGLASYSTSALTGGSHTVSVAYSGSNFYSASSSANLNQVVNAIATTTVVSTSLSPAQYGQPVTFTATVSAASGTPAGNIVFTIDGTAEPATTLTNGAATYTTSTLSVATHTVTAAYAGTASFAASSGTLGPAQQITLATTTTTLVSSANPSPQGSSVTFTATVAASGVTPAGSVKFYIDSNLVATQTLVSGAASYTTSTLSQSGSPHAVYASYIASATCTASTSQTLSQIIGTPQSTTVLTSSQNPSNFGQSVTFTATVSSPIGSPTGTVVFTVDGTAMAPTTLTAGTATLTTSTLTAGPHTISAAYSGDANDQASTSSTLTQTVNQDVSATTLVSSENPSDFSQPVTFTATVTGAGSPPTGTVMFTLDNIAQPAVTLVNGVGTLSTSTLSVGSHSLSVAYSGDIDYTSSLTANLVQTVNPAGSTVVVASAQNPAAYGQGVVLTTTVTGPEAGTPTGTVTLTIDGVAQTPLTLSGGTASYTATGLAIGSHTITASYSGDSVFPSSTTTGPLTEVISQASSTTTLVSSANPSSFGNNVVFTATVAGPGGTPQGSVVFTVDGTANPPLPLAAGTATFQSSTFGIGTHSISAMYQGSADYLSSTSSTINETIGTTPSTTTISTAGLNATYGTASSITVDVTGAGVGPTGTVNMFLDGTELTTLVNGVSTTSIPLTAGTATVPIGAPNAGSHSVTASYSGDANYAASSTAAPVTFTISQETPNVTLTTSGATASLGQSVTFTATVTPTVGTPPSPTGSVVFTIDGTAQPAVSLVSGVATLSSTGLTVGTHVIGAAYSGDVNNAAASAPSINQTITLQPTTTTINSNLNPSSFGTDVTLTATVASGTGTPAGNVTYTIDGVAQAPTPLSQGVATLTLNSLSAGSHTITAAYDGNAVYAASVTTPLTQTVGQSSSSIALTSSQNPSAVGSSVIVTATVSGSGSAPTGSVVFTVDGNAQPAAALSSGTASYTTSALTVGTHTITAAYSGDANYDATDTASAFDQVVNPVLATPSITSISPATGPIGAAITVNGQNLSGTTVVTFTGGSSATPTNVTATSLSVVVPAGAQTGTLTVTNPIGTAVSTQTYTVLGTLHEYAKGLVMIGAPVDDSNFSLSQDFDQTVKFAVWNPTSVSYAVSPTAPADTIRPGQGYWARFTTPTNLVDLSTTVASSQTVSINLAKGWNMIGVPRTASVPASAMGISVSGQVESFSSAVAAGLVSDTLYTFQAGDTNYEVLSGSSGNLLAYQGYWIYADQPCTFVFGAQ